MKAQLAKIKKMLNEDYDHEDIIDYINSLIAKA